MIFENPFENRLYPHTAPGVTYIMTGITMMVIAALSATLLVDAMADAMNPERARTAQSAMFGYAATIGAVGAVVAGIGVFRFVRREMPHDHHAAALRRRDTTGSMVLFGILVLFVTAIVALNDLVGGAWDLRLVLATLAIVLIVSALAFLIHARRDGPGHMSLPDALPTKERVLIAIAGIGIGPAFYGGAILTKVAPTGLLKIILQVTVAVGILLIIPGIIAIASRGVVRANPLERPEGLAGFFVGTLIFWAAMGAAQAGGSFDGEPGYGCSGDHLREDLEATWINTTAMARPATYIPALQGPYSVTLGSWTGPGNATFVNITPWWAGGPDRLDLRLERLGEGGAWDLLASESMSSGQALEVGRHKLGGEDLRWRLVQGPDDDVSIATLFEFQHEVVHWTCINDDGVPVDRDGRPT